MREVVGWRVPILVVALVLLVPGVASADNNPPTAVAGPNQTVNENASVTLDGSASSDPDGDPLTFEWTQTAGSPVALSDASAVRPTFTAPAQPPLGQETLRFRLVVTDSFGLSSSPSTTDVFVQDIYSPPDCSQARPSSDVLSKADQKLQSVTIVGVRERDPDVHVTVSVTSVFQDEPLTGGEDHTSPDAVLQPSGGVSLRAERRSSGDGRVYHASFTASDGFGGSCSGVATVSVPRKKGVPAIDGGSLYNSLGS
jgi:hypothetical protein